MDGIHIDREHLAFGAGDSDSAGGNCPAAVKVTSARGGAVFQGKMLDAATLDGVRAETAAHGKPMGTDETAVWLPDNVIAAIRSGALG